MDEMTPSGFTREELLMMRMEHELRSLVPTVPRLRRTARPKRATKAGKDALTVADVAKSLGVSEDHVLGLIRSGRLRATNIGRGARRPRWRIATDDLKAFLSGGATSPRRRSRKTPDRIEMEYF